jgi:hypothetical protein
MRLPIRPSCARPTIAPVWALRQPAALRNFRASAASSYVADESKARWLSSGWGDHFFACPGNCIHAPTLDFFARVATAAVNVRCGSKSRRERRTSPCPLLAQSGPPAMSAFAPRMGVERTFSGQVRAIWFMSKRLAPRATVGGVASPEPTNRRSPLSVNVVGRGAESVPPAPRPPANEIDSPSVPAMATKAYGRAGVAGALASGYLTLLCAHRARSG